MKRKKLLLAATFLTLSLGLAACKGTSTIPETITAPAVSETTEIALSSEVTETETDGELSDLNALGDIKADEGLFDVELTIPKDYVGETTQENLDLTAKEMGYKSITLNEDGSATYLLTKKQHNSMMMEMKNNINSSLQEMIASEDYPNITAISANEDFTAFEITTKSKELDMAESFSTLGFYMYGGMYNIFNGTPVDDISVTFLNAESGEIISTANSNEQ